MSANSATNNVELTTMASSVNANAGADRRILTLTIWAPNQPDPRVFDWPMTMKVADAASAAAAAFGLAQPNMLKLQIDDETGRVLDPNKTLVAERLKDGDSLTLVADGGGV